VNRPAARCPVCGAANFACHAGTGLTFLRRQRADARWLSTRNVYRRIDRGGYVLEFTKHDPVDVLEAVRQRIVAVADLSDDERRHLVDVAKRKLARARGSLRSVTDEPVEDKAMSPKDVVRRAMELYADEEEVDGPPRRR
jgi:hypothetical protein